MEDPPSLGFPFSGGKSQDDGFGSHHPFDLNPEIDFVGNRFD